MQVDLTPDQLEELNKLASAIGRSADELVREAIDNLLAYNKWFGEQVEIGLSQARQGIFIEDEEVRARIDRLSQP